MDSFRALMMGVIGLLGLGYVLRAIARGAINLGRQREFIVTFADDPGLYLFGVVFISVLSGGALLVAWRHFTGPRDE